MHTTTTDRFVPPADTPAPREVARALTLGLLAAGYREGPPTRAAGEIDRAVAEAHPCPDCGAFGREFLAFTGGGSYLGFALCHACGACPEV